jgi:hypothetical protein
MDMLLTGGLVSQDGWQREAAARVLTRVYTKGKIILIFVTYALFELFA